MPRETVERETPDSLPIASSVSDITSPCLPVLGSLPTRLYGKPLLGLRSCLIPLPGSALTNSISQLSPLVKREGISTDFGWTFPVRCCVRERSLTRQAIEHEGLRLNDERLPVLAAAQRQTEPPRSTSPALAQDDFYVVVVAKSVRRDQATA